MKLSAQLDLPQVETQRGLAPAGPQVPLIIAHRGASSAAPENTLAAFELAITEGADGIELDVHLSSDGVPVVIHDSRLHRTTSGRGYVGAHSVRWLRRLDAGSWFNRRYPTRAAARNVGLKVPLLAEVLAWVKGRQCRTFLELKEGGDAYPGMERRVVEEIARTGVEKWITVTSFHLRTLRRVRKLDRRLELGLNFSHPLRAVRRARSVGAATVHPYSLFCPRAFIRRAQRARLRVIVWGVDDAQAMRQKMIGGVDGLMTRRPAQALALRSALWARKNFSI